MDRNLIDYFMSPVLNIYYFIHENDFQKNYLYFFICEIICLFMDFFSSVYNEYLLLFCCNLSYDTKDEISRRANHVEMYDSIITLKRQELNSISSDENWVFDSDLNSMNSKNSINSMSSKNSTN